jgi:hypothetical protein
MTVVVFGERRAWRGEWRMRRRLAKLMTGRKDGRKKTRHEGGLSATSEPDQAALADS